MGTFPVLIEIGDPQGERFEQIEALVDTGASDTVVPASLLRNLGVQVQETWPFELAENHKVELDIGYTMFRLDGRVRPALVVFGSEETIPLLGASTLEAFHLAVDPVHRRLVAVPGLLM
jgi:clan AA aspartic protease